MNDGPSHLVSMYGPGPGVLQAAVPPQLALVDLHVVQLRVPAVRVVQDHERLLLPPA